MNPRHEGERCHDLGFGGRELGFSFCDGLGLVVQASEFTEELRVTRLRSRQVSVEARQVGNVEVRREKLQSLVRARLDEPEDEQPIGQPALVRTGEGEQLLRVGIARIRS